MSLEIRIGRSENKSFRFRKYIMIVLLLLLLFYFAYQMMNGERGILALFDLTKKHRVLDQDIKKLENQKMLLEKNIYMLKPESLNLDLLDEQARRSLGYGKEGETVYLD